ncbi:hypothetical protein BBP40_002225 [Aspergillus hancockii]|nr:hypothetical protein BBP40_002225 [Aspergillus hancockii]
MSSAHSQQASADPAGNAESSLPDYLSRSVYILAPEFWGSRRNGSGYVWAAPPRVGQGDATRPPVCAPGAVTGIAEPSEEWTKGGEASGCDAEAGFDVGPDRDVGRGV